jgi:predicted RND superfamily exporter protein
MWAQAEDENRNPVMVEVTDNVILGLYIANSINLAINVIGILIVTLSILVFYRRPLFHYNLVCLMTCGYFSGIFMTAAGIANSIAGFLDLSILSKL